MKTHKTNSNREGRFEWVGDTLQQTAGTCDVPRLSADPAKAARQIRRQTGSCLNLRTDHRGCYVWEERAMEVKGN